MQVRMLNILLIILEKLTCCLFSVLSLQGNPLRQLFSECSVTLFLIYRKEALKASFGYIQTY